jgi:hypothetical protein
MRLCANHVSSIPSSSPQRGGFVKFYLSAYRRVARATRSHWAVQMGCFNSQLVSLPQKAGVTQSDVSPSFFFPLYLSLSSGTGGVKDKDKE